MLACENRYKNLILLLLKEKNSDEFWSGQLASSALATAVAMVAFKVQGLPESQNRIDNGLSWLLSHVNNDGGYGDTPESSSNVSTSLLCYAAISYCQSEDISGKSALSGIEHYLASQQIHFSENMIGAILKFYGKDYTFSVPILSMLVICKVLDNEAIVHIPQLPFEFTIFPSSWYGFFNMQVVSYAIPALVAVGIFVHKKRIYRNPFVKAIRNKSISPAMKKLSAMIPESGGFLEAIPLTAFVCMCLMASQTENDFVIGKGINFLKQKQRPDGSWPIDTDLSTWVTTLSIKALASDVPNFLQPETIENLTIHLLNIQYKEKHPFNQALPGGWGWTNFSGSVPDVDDTAGAILALLELYQGKNEETQAVLNGCYWLTRIQNNDGGFPTFCKGWTRLPFDSSCADLTGHTMVAFVKTIEKLGNKVPISMKRSFLKCIHKAIIFLNKKQHISGYWLPLWFGNQQSANKENPVYGTAKVNTYIQDILHSEVLDTHQKTDLNDMVSKANHFLLQQQNKDGSWGGSKGIQGSMEETALAICALTKTDYNACRNGLQWLDNEFNSNGLRSSPIGLYFAALWYDEKMYPLIYYIEALRRYLEIVPNNSNIQIQKL